MSSLRLVLSPNPLLNKVSSPVEKVDDSIRKLMDEMLTTMYHEDGVGLSAVQVGVLKRVVVMDVKYVAEKCEDNGCGHTHQTSNPEPIFMANPVVIKASKELSSVFEGCLSFPDFRTDIARPAEVTVEYLDYNGDKKTMDVDGILATCIQHEIDHLNGVTLVDHLSKLKREMVLKKMKKRNS